MSEDIDDILLIREGTEHDTSLVYSSWLRSYYPSNAVRGVTRDLYYKEQHRIIERLLESADLTIVADKSDPDNIIGWMLSDHGWLHYIFVKKDYRHMGMAKKLLSTEEWIGCTHETPEFKKINKQQITYNPYRRWYR